VRPLRLRTSDAVSLEAELTVPTTPIAAVVLAHPHPLHGGSMQSLVTSELFRTLPDASCAVIRFNFRGVGTSEGAHGDAIAEQLDIVAAIDTITSAAPDVPVVVSGWSFGGDTSLAVVDPRIDGLVAQTTHQHPALRVSVARPIGPEASLLTLLDARLRSALAAARVLELDGLILSSATKEVLPITSLDGRTVGTGRPGPVFANLLLADEINRAPAKVQSALLEVMQERQVTIGRTTYPAPDPFLEAARRLSLAPGRCIAFEDSDTGAAAARAAGMVVVQVPDMVPSTGPHAHHLADSLMDGARLAGLI